MSESNDIPTPGATFETAEETEAAAGGPGLRGNPIVKGLLETEPDPGEPPETPTSHYLAGLKKFANGAAGAGMGHGTTAAEHFVRGTVGLLTEPDTDESDPDEPGPVAREELDE
jgi:hypothetical protein